MEVKNVILVCLIFACVTINSVQSASFHYRNGREIEVPAANEINREEIVSELRKEPEVTAIEIEPVAAIVREDVIVPVDQLRVVAPVIEIQEPVAFVSEKEESNAVVDEVAPLRSAHAESIVPVVVEENVNVPIVEEPAAVEEVFSKTRNEPLVGIDEKVVVPVVKTEEKETPIEVETVFLRSSPDESLIVENVVNADSPIAENDEAIRQNVAAPAAPAVPAVPVAPVRPPFIQAIQNFQQQIQSVLNPAAANSDPADPTTPRPGFIVQFQQAVGSVFNRPAGSAPNPIQGLVSAFQNNIQTNFQGLFRPGGAPAAVAPAPAPAAETVPVVVAPVAEKIMLDEVPVVNTKVDTVQKVNEKVDVVKSD